jgi:hypothetical protein
MEKIFLERIIDTIKLSDCGDFSNNLADLTNAYEKQDIANAVKIAYNTLKDMSGKVLTSSNLKTVAGTAKIINYINLYNEVGTFLNLYTNTTAEKTDRHE